MTDPVAIHWFRQDLRLADNPALMRAAAHQNLLPVYILDDENAGMHKPGAASRWWLHHSLAALQKTLGGNLSFYRGNPADILGDIVQRLDARAIFWNRCHEPWAMERDARIKSHFAGHGLTVQSDNGAALWEPWEITKDDGTPYKVFTPFYRKGCLGAPEPRAPVPAPARVNWLHDTAGSLSLEDLDLLPKVRWDRKLAPHWQIGEAGAHERFRRFVAEGLSNYRDGRNFPASPFVSRLSPHLHFGEISPHQLWHGVRAMGLDRNVEHFCSELGWREFSLHLLYHNPDLPTHNLQPKFDAFPWNNDSALLRAWQKGRTGVPMVDAAMRELWQTGYMHNRSRMIAGSFLVKNLRIDWRAGARWFWDTLIDADLANNSAGWQWIAGCGADAAPYFRIFNPVTQGQKFDPDGAYVRRFIPEIAALPGRYLFSPWEAPVDVLRAAEIERNATWPDPVVDLKQSRNAALAAFQSLKTGEG